MVREILQETVVGETKVKMEAVTSSQVGGLTKLKVAELREKLCEQGLSTAGTKPILVARLKEALQGSSPSLVGTPRKAETEETPGPGTGRRSKRLSESQAELSRPATPVKRIKEETSRASTPVRTSRRLSASLECPVVDNPVQEKASIETIVEDTEEQPAAEIEADTELKVIKEQPQQNEAPAAEKPEAKKVKEKPEKENIPLDKMLDQLFTSKSIPRQKPKSGRFWKGERAQFRQIKRDRGQRPTFEQRLKMKEEKLRNQELAEMMKNRKKQEKEELRKRIEENKAKKLENERKTEQYQLIKNPAKLKRMKKRQLRMLEKRDILPTK